MRDIWLGGVPYAMSAGNMTRMKIPVDIVGEDFRAKGCDVTGWLY